MATHEPSFIRPEDRLPIGVAVGVVVLLQIVAWGLLIVLVVPHHVAVSTQMLGIGLGVTAYALGLRHAFDADHVAAIDSATRRLVARRRRPTSVGFWFALGHSTVVLLLAALIAAGAHLVAALTSAGAGADAMTYQKLSLFGAGVAGLFLLLIAGLNLVALVGTVRMWHGMRRGRLDEVDVAARLNSGGLCNRFLGELTRSVTQPGQMYPVGMVFGMGFDTAAEVTLLVLAGSAAGGLPWYGVVALPLLFAAGLSLPDTIDGAVTHYVHDRPFANPVRKTYYSITITGLSVAAALIIGSIELVAVLHDDLGFGDPVTTWIAQLNLNNVGFGVVGMFVVVWAAAIGYWRFAKLDHRTGRH
ncbi:MAG TPA: HoxN/HupN/NixA family nickel/cobalt transporter [Pseudonocardiaceae bacterium]|nr:HoxN/HupN/NixA family nickel/cobalt transporter [Pseudonocardiaceae bacterium]